MNSGRSKVLRGTLSGFACTAATRTLQTDIAFGRRADPRARILNAHFSANAVGVRTRQPGPLCAGYQPPIRNAC